MRSGLFDFEDDPSLLGPSEMSWSATTAVKVFVVLAHAVVALGGHPGLPFEIGPARRDELRGTVRVLDEDEGAW